MNASTPSPPHPGLFWLVLFGVAYLAGSWLGHWLTLTPSAGVTLWPPSGLYLAALLVSEKRHWPWWIMAGLPAEIIGSTALFELPLPAVLAIYLGNTLEALAGAWLVRRWCGAAFRLDGLKAVLALTLCGAVLSPALSATLGAATLDAIGKGPFANAWLLWWVGDAVGVLIVTPLVLTVVHSGAALWQMKSERWAEWLAMLAVFVTFAHLVFSGGFPFVYIVMPPLLWGALRFGVPGATATVLILALMAARYTATGRGVFANPAFDPEQRQWLVQLFLGIAAVTALVVAALATQSRRALLTLRQAHDELDARVTERTAALRESEERLRLFIEYVPAAVAMFDRDMRYLAVSRRWRDDYRLTGEPLGRAHYEAFPEMPERWKEVHRRVLADEVINASEDRFVRADGTVQWLRWEARPWRGADDNTIGGIIIFTEDISGRKQAELALQAQSELLAAINDNIPVMLCVWNPSLKGFRFNQHLRDVLGWTESDVAGGDFLAKCYPDPAHRQWVVDYMLSLEGGWRDMRSTAKDGSLVDTAWANVRLPDGTTIGIGLDIRQRKADEAALRDSEQRCRTIFEASRDGIATAAPDGPILDANPAFQAMLGYSLEELRSLTYQQLTLPRWHAIEDAIVRERVLAHGDSGEYEKEYIRKDGGVFPISIRTWPLWGADGHLVGFQGIVRDITERKQTEEALRASEERFRAVFENAGIGIAIADREGRFQQCNPAYCELLGYTEEEFRQITFPDLLHPDDRAANLAENRRLQDEELPSFEIENRYLRKDGGTVWVRKFVSLLRDAAGKPSHLVALITDVTEQRRMAEALREADQRKDEFLATLAHELRNPLAPISNALHLLHQSSAKEPATERLHAMMRRQVGHLVRLVDDLLEVSRISRGKIELRKERVDLAAVLGHALETSQPLIKAAGHQLSVALPPEPICLDADPVRLAQVFANLLNNAAKYTEPGGRIQITAERQGGVAVVSIRDSGVGIPVEMLPRVFDLFAQVDRSLGRAQGGLGIGLALVRNLVEMHGGRVEAHSEGMGRGAEFKVRLPLAATRPLAADGPQTPAVEPGPSRRLLVVDDNRDAADSLALLLDALDYDVRVAYDGSTALDILGAFKPAVVLLDIGMPGMDGYETARRVRRHPAGQDVTLIALTGWGQEEDRRRTQAAGFDHHLVKPVDIERLQSLLAEVK
ncbi:PAS domain S-box protein [Methylomagnum sp.]